MTNTIECAAPACTTEIPRARAVLPISNGMCPPCNRSNLACTQEDLSPEYETEVWARGGKL